MGMIATIFSRRSDFRYAISKGFGAAFRGTLWQVLRLRRPRILFLGQGIKFVLSNNLRLGNRVTIGSHSYIETCAETPVIFADGVTLRENAWVQCRSGFNPKGIGLELQRGVYIGPNAVIGVSGKITIQAGSQIGAGLCLSAESHEFDKGSYTTGTTNRKGIKIGRNCWLGNNVTVLDGVEIGMGAVIGAGSVVTRSIPANSVAVGIPARIIRSTVTLKNDEASLA